MRYTAPAGLAVGLGLLLTACGGSQPAAAHSDMSTPPAASSSAAPASAATSAVREINASGMGGAFDPAMLTVKVGTTVRWTNASGNIHNVTFADAAIKPSSIMYGAATFEYTFTRAGTFQYRCTFHPGMDGTVVVEAA